jgi:heavy metal translocating P-type ATPase
MFYIPRNPSTLALASATGGLVLGKLVDPVVAPWLQGTGLVLGGLGVLWDFGGKIRRREGGSDLLAVLCIVVSLLTQEYFAGLIIVIMASGGELLESLATSRASSVIDALVRRMPSETLRRASDGSLSSVAVQDLLIGDLVVVSPHGICPADGTVTEGYGVMDEAYLTGEPTQVPKAPGAAALSGAINGDAALVIKVTKLPNDSRYAKILEVIDATTQQQIPIRRLGDRIGMLFAPIAIVFALVCWAVTRDHDRFLSVLVVATPCPLLIAIPVAILGAISVAARHGVLIRHAALLELLPTCRTFILDKTGTLTLATPELVEIRLLGTESHQQVMSYLGSLEQYSRHPLSRAVMNRVRLDSIALERVEQVQELPGTGLRGEIRGATVRIVGRKHLPKDVQLEAVITAGLECFLIVGCRVSAHCIFRDTPRPESRSFIGHLAEKHAIRRVMLVSGDRKSEVSYMADALHIEHVRAEIQPEGKLAIVRDEMKSAPVAFIGDGINDTPALVAATVGIAFGEGSDVTSNAADAVVMNSDLRAVDRLLHISFFTRRVILQSAVGGIAISLVAMLFAAYGMITPAEGAILQEVIDLLAVGNALRISFYKGNLSDFD